MFATVVFAAIDVRSGDVHYVNADHDAPMVVAGHTVRERWDPSAPAVGLVAGVDFTVQRSQIEPGELALFYTDGVVEARGSSGLFGEPRLLKVIARHNGDAGALLEGVTAGLQEHTATFEPSDDVTLVAVRRG